MKNKAFSLAEALITLLIVSLIAIASIPVITKKKRPLEDGDHGEWVCTLNANGQHIVWDKNTDADKNDYTKWKVTGSSCTFVPPQRARNFGLTLMGGGGGGEKGTSEFKYYLNDSNTSYRPDVDGTYDIAMVGGGGGGAPGSGNSGSGGSGGAAGGFLVGTIKLLKNQTYTFSKGWGGNPVFSVDYSQSSEPWADGGGESILYANGVYVVKATGGQGGNSRTCKRRWGTWKCGGGNTSSGGCVENSTVLNSMSFGGSRGCGESGTNAESGSYTRGGSGTYVGTNVYGGGGRGRYQQRSGAEAGKAGIVQISQTKILSGLGGSASMPVIVPLPKIPGTIKITIGTGGDGGNADKKAQQGLSTNAKMLNTSGSLLREYTAPGGLGGTEGVDKIPTLGQNSLWKGYGGGLVGTCKPKTNAYYSYELVTEKVPTGKCLFYLGVTTSYDTSCLSPTVPLASGGAIYNKCKYTPEGSKYDSGMCIFDDGSEDEADGGPSVEDITPSAYAAMMGPYRAYWSRNMAFTYECVISELKTQTSYRYVYHPALPARCDDSMPGTSYGAGGGGGPASDTIGVFGNGGKGAPGAVIIEW